MTSVIDIQHDSWFLYLISQRIYPCRGARVQKRIAGNLWRKMCDECQTARHEDPDRTRSHLLYLQLKEHFEVAEATGRVGTRDDGALENSSGTVKWYNIEIYFYADDDDHHLMGEPVAVAMALLLAMPMPWLPPAPALSSKLPSCRERCRVPLPIGQMSKQRKFIMSQWQQPESSKILNFKYDGNLSKGVDGTSDTFGQTVLGQESFENGQILNKILQTPS